MPLALRPRLGLDSKAWGHDSHFGQVEGFTCSGLDLSPLFLARPPPPPSNTHTHTTRRLF